MWHGLLYIVTVYDAVICCDVDCLLQMAHEQRSWPNNVFPLLWLRRRFAYVRVRTFDVSILKSEPHICISITLTTTTLHIHLWFITIPQIIINSD